MKEEITELIIRQIADIAQPNSAIVVPELNDQTPLYGRKGMFDSVGLVSLIVAVEQAVEDRFGKIVSLADERAMSRTSSPFRTIGSLAEYVDQLLYRALAVWLSSDIVAEVFWTVEAI